MYALSKRIFREFSKLKPKKNLCSNNTKFLFCAQTSKRIFYNFTLLKTPNLTFEYTF